jgi:hypothetical protein
MTPQAAERAMKALGALQTAIGIGVLAAPASDVELAGLHWRRMTGESLFGWRLFAVRQVLLGAGVAAGIEPVRRANWLLQPADLALFVHAYRTRSIPRRTAVLSLGLASGAICTLILARAAERSQSTRLGGAGPPAC